MYAGCACDYKFKYSSEIEMNNSNNDDNVVADNENGRHCSLKCIGNFGYFSPSRKSLSHSRSVFYGDGLVFSHTHVLCKTAPNDTSERSSSSNKNNNNCGNSTIHADDEKSRMKIV